MHACGNPVQGPRESAYAAHGQSFPHSATEGEPVNQSERNASHPSVDDACRLTTLSMIERDAESCIVVASNPLNEK